MPVREYCDVCRAPIEPEHRHMLATAMHKTTCVCEACALRLQQLLPEHVNTEVPV